MLSWKNWSRSPWKKDDVVLGPAGSKAEVVFVCSAGFLLQLRWLMYIQLKCTGFSNKIIGSFKTHHPE